jgi:RHS repeat-associated protein
LPAVGVFTNWFKHNLYGGAYGGKQNYFVNLRNGLSQSTYDQIITYFLGQSSVYTDSMNLSEWHIYGSSRIGIYQTSINMAYRNIRIVNSVTTQETSTTVTLPSYTLFSVERGSKRYELTNHLGNVLAVVSDKKIQVCTSTAISYYTADLVSATDYSPFGAPLSGRSYTAPSTSYRFAFNGKERDNETYGEGNAYDFGARIYDVRLGKWMSCDPLQKLYIGSSPYSYVLSNPINFIDKDGKAVFIIVYADAEEAFKAAAMTRQREIEGGVGFDSKKDHVYIVILNDISKLPEQIAECVHDASINKYGKTVEFDVYSHGGNDGTIGNHQENPGDCDYGKQSKDVMKQSQMTPECWKKINFNFDRSRSMANFYHCKGENFATKFMEYQPNVKYTGAPGYKEVSASYSLNKYDDAIGIFGTDCNKNVWMLSFDCDEENDCTGTSMVIFKRDFKGNACQVNNTNIRANAYINKSGDIRGKCLNDVGQVVDSKIK